jgi:hypothetical protein
MHPLLHLATRHLLPSCSISDADVSAEEARLASAPQHVAEGYKEFMDNLK